MGRLSVKKQRCKRQRQKARKKRTQQQPINNCRKENITDRNSLVPLALPAATSADSDSPVKEFNPDSNSSLGSPDWPPPSPNSPPSECQNLEISLNNGSVESNHSPLNCNDSDSSNDHAIPEPLSREEISLYGIDGTVFCYNQDEKSGFQLADGRYLEGDELIDFLVMNNGKLAAKAQFYHSKYCKASTEISVRSVAAKQKMERIRQFYQSILYGNSRSGLMVQKAIARNVR